MQFFVILPNGSKIDIELDSDKKVVDIISIMDKSDRIQSLGLIDHFHLWFQPESGGKVNLMKDLNKTIGDYGITLESNINMQVEHTTLLEIAMNISKSRAIDRLTPDFESEAEKIQKRFRGNRERKELREQYPETFNKVTKGWVTIRGFAYSGDIGPLSGVRNEPVQHSERKEVVKELGLIAYAEECRNNTQWWPRDQTKDPNEMLLNTTKTEKFNYSNTHISPGIDIKLLVEKSRDFFVRFEEEEDRIKFLEMGGTSPPMAPMPTSKLRIREGSKWSGLFLHEALFNILIQDGVNYDIVRWASEFSEKRVISGAKKMKASKKKGATERKDEVKPVERFPSGYGYNYENPIQFTKIFYQWYLDNIVQLDQTEIDNFIKENNIRYTSKSGYSKKDKPKKNKPKKKKQTQKKEKKKKKKKKN